MPVQLQERGARLFNLMQTNEVTDSAYVGSESTYSECETFTDEDTGALAHYEMSDEVQQDSTIEIHLNGSLLLDTVRGESVLMHPSVLPCEARLQQRRLHLKNALPNSITRST